MTPLRPACKRLSFLLACMAANPAIAADHVTLEDLARRLQALEQHAGSRQSDQPNPIDTVALEQRLRILERKLELQDEDAASSAETQPKVGLSATRGLSIKSPTSDGIELFLKGLVQADGRMFFDEAQNAQNTFLLRRVEPTLEGTWGPLLGFRLQAQLAGDTATVNDAYVELRLDPRATLRAGKFKAPFGLEQLQPSSNLSAIERGLPTELTPGRDHGLQLQGAFLKGALNYAVEVSNGTPDGRDGPSSNPDNHFDYTARVFWEPFKDDASAWSGLGFGLAGSIGETFGSGDNVLPRYRTPGQARFFSYRTDASTGGSDVYADGRHRRLSPQGYFYRGRFGLLAEYVASDQELRLTGGPSDGIRRRLHNDAFGVTASVVLTGEDASYRISVRPAHPFLSGSGSWGAFELVTRYGKLAIDPDAFPLFANPDKSAASAISWGIGLNWYLTNNLKLSAIFTDTRFDGGAAGGLNRENEQALFTRAQLSF